MSWFYRILHIFFMGRAISRGPRYFGRYELRRQARKSFYRATRSRHRS